MGIGLMTNFSTRSESFWLRESFDYMIDAGQGKVGENLIKKLENQGYILDVFVISHGDSDHIDLAKEVILRLKPRIIVISPVIYAWEHLKRQCNLLQDSLNLIKFQEFLPQELLGEDDVTEYDIINHIPDYIDFPKIEENDEESIITEPLIYAVRRDTTPEFPWNKKSNQGLPEFETYPTTSSVDLYKEITSFTQFLKYNFKSLKDKRTVQEINDFLQGVNVANSLYNSNDNHYGHLINVLFN